MKRWLAIRRTRTALTLLVAAVLLLPWPFYLVAVLSIDPVVVGAWMGIALLPFAVIVLPQVALAIYILDLGARTLASRIDASAHPHVALAAALAVVGAVTFAPLYGGGENIAGGMRLHNLYRYLAIARGEPDREMLESVLGDKRGQGARQPLPPNATIESLGGAQVVIRPQRPIPITPVPCTVGMPDCPAKDAAPPDRR